LARSYAGADVLVFPSRTDTFGLVMLESLACRTPVATFPVTGPIDVFDNAHGRIGAINSDLRLAALETLTADRSACRSHAQRYSWRACAEMFLSLLVPLRQDQADAATAPASISTMNR
jgi:1,2-diacylglycerol 3-alpha-glucosyltransferase/glucuronosyltransferase